MPRGRWIKEHHPYGYDYWNWIEDPNGPDWRNPPPWEGMGKPCLFVSVFLLCVVIVGVVGFFWIRNNYVPKNEFVAGSSWHGEVYPYGTDGNLPMLGTNMSLTVDSVGNGTFTATVQGSGSNTGTDIEGVVVTNTSDKHWTYVIHPSGTHLFSECPKGGVYLQFVIMNASYFAVACGEELDGVWFSPDKPNSEPEGDFSLSKQ